LPNPPKGGIIRYGRFVGGSYLTWNEGGKKGKVSEKVPFTDRAALRQWIVKPRYTNGRAKDTKEDTREQLERVLTSHSEKVGV